MASVQIIPGNGFVTFALLNIPRLYREIIGYTCVSVEKNWFGLITLIPRDPKKVLRNVHLMGRLMRQLAQKVIIYMQLRKRFIYYH